MRKLDDRTRDLLNGGLLPPTAKAAEGYVATPAALAQRLVREYAYVPMLEPRSVVLEPSAGDGAIVRAVHDANPDVWVYAVEPNMERLSALPEERVTEQYSTLEEFADLCAVAGWHFSAVVMNPPFSVPGNRTIWIDHVLLAWDLLKPGGRLVSIAPAGYTFRNDKRHAAFRALIERHGGGCEQLPPDAFKASGADIQAVVIYADKPAEANPSHARQAEAARRLGFPAGAPVQPADREPVTQAGQIEAPAMAAHGADPWGGLLDALGV